ncbi:hypothetical protein BZA77DRAFT_302842 [Pyronema omphalodes]|nr:hypothetical protein BZA77DRAFT_302842 [Pyronema omphalodes]
MTSKSSSPFIPHKSEKQAFSKTPQDSTSITANIMLILEAIVSRANYYLEYYIPQKKREEKLHELYKFAVAKPYFAAYVATFLFFAFIPILGFTIFVVSLAIILAATAAFWLGVALTVVAGFLMVSLTLATLTYAYLVALFTAGQWARTTFLKPKQSSSEKNGEVVKPESEPEPEAKVKPEIKEEPAPAAVPENEQPEIKPVETSEEEEDDEDEDDEEEDDEDEENAYQDTETPRSREGESFEEVKRDEFHDAQREADSEKMRRDIEKSLR